LGFAGVKESQRTIAGVVRPGIDTALPLPYNFSPDKESLKVIGSGEIKILTDGRGAYVLRSSGESPIQFLVSIDKKEIISNEQTKEEVVNIANFELTGLSKETREAIDEIGSNKTSNLEKVGLVKKYVKTHLEYSNDSSMNAIYQSGTASEYVARIDAGKKADCDFANTYFIALLSSLKIPARLVVGHYVKSKDAGGRAVLSSGTGHAWSEVLIGGEWQRFDATPKGDPNMDEEETDEQAEDEKQEGDFGEEDAPEISDEELDEMLEQAQRAILERKEGPEKKLEIAFAEEAGCTPEQAKSILAEIKLARELLDNRRESIQRRLIREFQKIVEANRVDRSRYVAPVRMSRGQTLEDPVEAVLEMRAGVADPTGFARYEKKIELEQIYGGFDVLFVADKSGSMNEADSQSGHAKYLDQQRMIFLLCDSLYEAEKSLKRVGVKLISPLSIQTGVISFQSGEAKVELPLSTEWGPKQQFQLWQGLQSNVGGGNADAKALKIVEKIFKDDAEIKKSKKPRLRLVLVSADGGSDDVSAVATHKEVLKRQGVVVKAGGIGSGARAVESSYYPDGKNLPSFSSLPEWVSEQVISEAKKMYPHKIKAV
jgi:hypothetical protein